MSFGLVTPTSVADSVPVPKDEMISMTRDDVDMCTMLHEQHSKAESEPRQAACYHAMLHAGGQVNIRCNGAEGRGRSKVTRRDELMVLTLLVTISSSD